MEWSLNFLAVLFIGVKALVLFALLLLGPQLVALPLALIVLAVALGVRKLASANTLEVILFALTVIFSRVLAFIADIITLAVLDVKDLTMGASTDSLVETILEWDADVVPVGVGFVRETTSPNTLEWLGQRSDRRAWVNGCSWVHGWVNRSDSIHRRSWVN